MSGSVCYDVTHLLARAGIAAPSGIDKVDLAYGRHFAGRRSGPGVHYGLLRPHVLAPQRTREIVDLASVSTWEGRDADSDPAFGALRAAILGTRPAMRPDQPNADRKPAPRQVGWQRFRHGVAADAASMPPGAIYLNVAQFLFEKHQLFRWLQVRRDVRAVFFVHDLLPLDYAEYFPAGYKALFERRVQTMMTHGRAFIVTSEAVRTRVVQEMEQRQLRAVPMHVEPLPSTLGTARSADVSDVDLASQPYFVVLGTIEPRKNHGLLLNVWRHLVVQAAQVGGRVPKLVIVGGRGWENEQIIDVLDRGRITRPHVLEASGLSTAGLVRLLANACALLMPSFDEGYGLPLVEALSLGVPVVATDAPVFREVTQGCAAYLSPLDGLGWRQIVSELADRNATMSCRLRDLAARFAPPTWETYFDGVEGFLAEVDAS